ncbi:MAG: hypothetical protein PHW04_10695 [Candidatus Wallbacteria bacterium]|nr:hypothetical protein [Candidatus Wallbacteria bacterium]
MFRSSIFAVVIFFLSISLLFGASGYVFLPDVEQGGCLIAVSSTGNGIVFDSGANQTTDEDLMSFLNNLKSSGILKSLKFVVATHYDADHIGRLDKVLNSSLAGSDCIAYDRGTSGAPGTTAYSNYASAASSHHRTTIKANATLDLGGGMTFHCLCVNCDLPNGTHASISGSDENNFSIAGILSCGDFDLYYGGDLPKAMETKIVPFVKDIELYVFDHHGSDGASGSDLLTALKPEVGITQMGKNSYGHPNKSAVTRFENIRSTSGGRPLMIQTNYGDENDSRVDNSLANYIADKSMTLTGIVTKGGTVAVHVADSEYEISALGIDPPVTLSCDGSQSLAMAAF